MNIWFATNNAHKKKELEAIINLPLKIPSQEGFSFNPEETGLTFYENTLIKARELQKLLGNNDPVIADDSGLCVDALGGRPGVLSARYGMHKPRFRGVYNKFPYARRPKGVMENGKKMTSHEQNLLLLEELGDNPLRAARFVCSMVLLLSNDKFYVIQETIEGEIVKKSDMRGDGGFGYDPIFFVPQFGRTLAELTDEEKNAISHRGKAGKIIADLIKNNLKN